MKRRVRLGRTQLTSTSGASNAVWTSGGQSANSAGLFHVAPSSRLASSIVLASCQLLRHRPDLRRLIDSGRGLLSDSFSYISVAFSFPFAFVHVLLSRYLCCHALNARTPHGPDLFAISIYPQVHNSSVCALRVHLHNPGTPCCLAEGLVQSWPRTAGISLRLSCILHSIM